MKDENKWVNAAAYIVFFIPLLVDSRSETYKFHTNQGLDLLLLFLGISVVGGIIPIIGWFLILPFGSLACLVLAIIGITNAVNGKMKELPLIGKYQLIK